MEKNQQQTPESITLVKQTLQLQKQAQEQTEQKQEEAAKTLGNIDEDIQDAVTEQRDYLRRVEEDEDYQEERQLFLNKLSGVKKGMSRSGERDIPNELHAEFKDMPPKYRYDKEIILKLFEIKYHAYDCRGNSCGISTYHFDYKGIVSRLPDVLFHDKEFVLALMERLGVNKIATIIEKRYGSAYALREDKEFVKTILERSFDDKISWESIPFSPDTLKDAVQDDDLAELYYRKKGGKDRHKQPQQYRESPRHMLAAFEKGGIEDFKTYDREFKEEHPDYYPNLKKHIQALVTGKKERVVELITSDIFKLSDDMDIAPYLSKLDENYFEDPQFVCNLLRFNKELVSYCGELGEYILQFLEDVQSDGSYKNINWDSLDFGNHGLITYIQGTSRDSGGGGMEYGNYIVARKDGERERKHFVYRDAYDSQKDDRSLHFSQTEIEQVTVDEDENTLDVTVVGSSDAKSRAVDFTFALHASSRESLSKVEQELFLENYASAKEEVLAKKKEQYDGKTMPFYALPREQHFQGMSTDDYPYDQPRVISEATAPKTGRGVFVIKTQIDHSAGPQCKQWERQAYLVDEDGEVEQLTRECRRYNELTSGDTVMLSAEDLLYQDKQNS